MTASESGGATTGGQFDYTSSYAILRATHKALEEPIQHMRHTR
jgi:hypothetical protein